MRKKNSFSTNSKNKTENEQLVHAEIYGQYENKLEELLHASSKQEHLFKDAEVAEIVMAQIKKYDTQYYSLEAACIMSNHVHILLDFSVQIPLDWHGEIIPGYKNVGDVIGYIKGGSSYIVNKKKRGRKGTLWSMGYYDRYIRSPEHFAQAFYYTINNPVKAKLVSTWEQYPFTYVKEENVKLFL